MERTYWHKQTTDTPLFPDVLWSRPETKRTAGKLLIIGGNLHSFASVGNAYVEALSAGAGQIRLVMPDALKKTVSKLIPDADFLPSTPSGSFARLALAGLIDQAGWADGVLIAGDLGNNSETAILLEKFTDKYSGQLTLAKDAASHFADIPEILMDRQKTTMIVDITQLQHLAGQVKFSQPFTSNMDLIRMVDALHDFSQPFAPNIITQHLSNYVVAVDGEVSTTNVGTEKISWRIPTAAHAAVWWLQNPTNPFEALTTSIIDS